MKQLTTTTTQERKQYLVRSLFSFFGRNLFYRSYVRSQTLIVVSIEPESKIRFLIWKGYKVHHFSFLEKEGFFLTRLGQLVDTDKWHVPNAQQTHAESSQRVSSKWKFLRVLKIAWSVLKNRGFASSLACYHIRKWIGSRLREPTSQWSCSPLSIPIRKTRQEKIFRNFVNSLKLLLRFCFLLFYVRE